MAIGIEAEQSDGNFKLPKLTVIKKRFRELALKKHSDKGGDDAEFLQPWEVQ